MSRHVSADEIAEAREVHLLDYLEVKGEPIKAEGRQSTYYRHQEHDSLVFRDNMYVWNSRQEKGAGAISFAMMYYDLSFPEAVRDVNSGEYKALSTERKERKVIQDNESFEYPYFLEVRDQLAVRNYLTGERKIDARLVDWLFSKDLLAQDKKQNAVFKWRENGGSGEIIGADRQGTVKMKNKHGSFKQILPNGKEHGGFILDIGKPDKLIAFESPIDLLSYWSLHQDLSDARLVSMNGLKPKTLLVSHVEAKKAGHDIQKWVLAVDNDEGGHTFVCEMKKLFNEDLIEEDLPKEKDWNDELKHRHIHLIQEKKSIIQVKPTTCKTKVQLER